MGDGIIRNEKEMELTHEYMDKLHKQKMEYAEFLRTTEKLKHEWEMERFRIRNAEMKKLEQMKDYNRGR